MKKILLILMACLAATVLLLWYFFGGFWNAWKPASQDIAEVIERHTPPALQQPELTDTAPPLPHYGLDEVKPGQNETEFPLKLEAGFSISIFAKGLGPARAIVFDPNGVMIVSVTRSGSIIVLPDTDQDGKADRTIPLVSNLNNPHGLRFDCDNSEACKLYIAETDMVSRYDYDGANYRLSNREELMPLPDNGGHFTRSLEWLPGEPEKLLVSIGSKCNVCRETDERRAAVYLLNTITLESKPYSTGLRNAVFIRTNPATNQVWGTENERDWRGNDLPPDEINILKPDRNYGWPVCFGTDFRDPDFEPKVNYFANPCSPLQTESPHVELQAHSAPLGLDFFPTKGWPEEYHHDLLIGYHGSWNRDEPTGYKIFRVKLDKDGNVEGEEDFITGWLTVNNEVLGRPVDIAIRENGTLFISDDKAGVIYQVTYPLP